jgi:hypothetical protein
MKSKSHVFFNATIFLTVIAFLASILPGQMAKAATTTLTFKPVADAYVISTSASTNYGKATIIRVDNSPITRSYLRFSVSGLNGATVQSATLRIYANSNNSTGYTANTLSNNTWTETGITYSNAPAPGTAIKTSGSISAGAWIAVDVSSYVKADGSINLVLTTTSSTNTSLGSRESSNSPQLVIVTGATTATSTPVNQPTATKTSTQQPTSVGPTATKTPTQQPTGITPTATKVAPTATQSSGLTPVALTKGPDLLYSGSNTQMKLFWQWTANTTFRVDWGASTAYGSSSPAISAYDSTNHLYSYTITGLTPGTHYNYRVVVGNQYSAGSFLTAPQTSATTVNFVSYGDNRDNPSIQNTVAGLVDKLFQSDPSYQTFNLVCGDLTSAGDTDSNWTSQMFSSSFANIRTELANLSYLPVMGNHEGSGSLFLRYFPQPYVAAGYWSFDYGPVHVVMMDQYVSYGSGSAEYNWVKSDLAATTKKWKVVMIHEPGWSANGGHANNSTIQSVYEPLFEQYQVAMVVAGHNHYYARAMVNGIPELTIGTGGAPLYSPASGQPDIVKTYQGNGYAKFSISGSTLTGTFISSSGSTIDTFSVTR